MKSSKNRFLLWIDRRGAPAVARELGLNRATVWYWRNQICLPTTLQMIKIFKLTDGKIDPNTIVASKYPLRGHE